MSDMMMINSSFIMKFILNLPSGIQYPLQCEPNEKIKKIYEIIRR